VSHWFLILLDRSRCDGSARRLSNSMPMFRLEHDLFDSSVLANASSARPISCNQVGCDRRRLRHLWATDLARVRFRKQSNQIFTLDRRDGRFYQAVSAPIIARECAEYAINASNYRHWDAPVRAFIDDCVQGAEGPLKRNHNMRWTGSLVADAYRILLRVGFSFIPAITEPVIRTGGCGSFTRPSGCLYVELAGGLATDCVRPILDIVLQAFMPAYTRLLVQRQRSSS